MKRTALALTLLLALLCSAVTITRLSLLAKANPIPPPPDLQHIYIRSDGGIEPSTAPIQRNGEIYTLTNNINNYTIDVQRDNIILNGAGYALVGNRSNGIVASGIYLSHRNNVTIMQFKIHVFEYGIMNAYCANTTIIRNEITDNANGIEVMFSDSTYIFGNNITRDGTGIYVGESPNTVIDRNNITDNGRGIYVGTSNNNIVFGNLVSDNGDGLVLNGASNCSVYNNTFTKNDNGIRVDAAKENRIFNNEIAENVVGVSLWAYCNDNIFYGNSFLNNSQQVSDNCYRYSSSQYPEWAAAHPSSKNYWNSSITGNYWSDYAGTNKNADDVGDMPYVIDGFNTDYHPLTKPANSNITLALPDFLLNVLSLASSPNPSTTDTSPNQPPSPDSQVTEPFPTTLVAASVASVAVVGAGLIFYLRKRKH